ncbi:DAZ-associated protein-like protein [Dinothrombium tinctorium]|uniref:DAZ-associated protein 2 n=1 Tax=Dinothrombium tinctorium TaxID=1965070 RepID=A0A3S3P817_9ACAR|nr:DAZ-associated protein-like protein [Dinothrombium tinctorium]RWS07448.1 DAZ-associated protein-like protein [Dinothrombium tinctorium]RWS07561.1 DAZ-associated protein-like protein [Dinothrombium tinctorium]
MMGSQHSNEKKAASVPTAMSVPTAGYPVQGQPQAYASPSYYPQAYGQMYGQTTPAYSSYPPNAYDPPPPYTEKPIAPTYVPNYNAAPQATYVVPDAFEAGARFDGRVPPRIPPPPPGVMPNAAQMAALQGHNVVLGQKPSNFWSGGSGGGYTFW